MLSTSDHSRDSAGMIYIYPVISRRAGGVSIGINLNTNNACNWACVYCQVPNLVRGGPPPIDLDRLEDELTRFVGEIISGDFLLTQVPPEARQLKDIAISGNGEPTSAPEFADLVDRVGRLMLRTGLAGTVKLRLITNGSFLHREAVRTGITQIGALGGEVWFKVDRATPDGIKQINGIRLAPEKIRSALITCADLAPTWVQTCYFAMDGMPPDETEQTAYLALLGAIKEKIKGVLLYGLARPSLQPEANRLANVPADSFQHFAEKIAALGIEVIATA